MCQSLSHLRFFSFAEGFLEAIEAKMNNKGPTYAGPSR